MKKMKTKSSKKVLPATVFATIIVLSAFLVMCTTVSAQGSLDKTLDPIEGDLGDVVNVTINVTVGAGENVTVVDTLPSEFTYINGTFYVDGVEVIPTVEKRNISHTIEDPGDYTIKFDVKVTEAYWYDREVCNNVVGYNKTGYNIGSDTACFNISAFEELHKNVGIPKADVVFAIDLTGSMSGEIAEVKANATNIMNSLAAQIADVQFGLISFMDYNGTYNTSAPPGSVPPWYNATYGSAAAGDYPYKLDQDITSNTTLVNQTIGGLILGSGGDGPQDYTRIIHESYNDTNLTWRTDAKKILILFGDNVPHDTDFDYDNNGTPNNTGGDPGRDTILGTADDLDFEDEVANASAAGVHIMAVYSGSTLTRYPPWEYMANKTGGEYFKLEEAEQIPEAIQDLIKKQALETLTIEENNETQWAVVIDIVNPFDYIMTDTVITDRFGAEIEIDDPFPYNITHGTVSNTTTEDKSKGKVKGKPDKRKGTSKKVFLNWTIGDLGPGETARLILLVSTDLNPAGHQEYTTPTEPGEYYEMNSGATLKFKDPEQDMMQLSAVTDSIYVTVLPEED